MTDIRTIFIDMSKGLDFAISDLGLVEDDGLQTAVILSLFTDRRAKDDDILPGGDSDKRGWWGDAFPFSPDDKIGSRRWLLSREKQLSSVLRRVKDYDEEALKWLVDDGIALSVTVTANIVSNGILGETIEIVRPDKTNASFRFESLWSNT
jgi:phage gp46-like protein